MPAQTLPSERIQLVYAKLSAGSQSALTQQAVVCVREELDASRVSTKPIGLKLAVMARIMSVQHRAIIMNTVRGDILPPKIGAHIYCLHGNVCARKYCFDAFYLRKHGYAMNMAYILCRK
jgi:hypothetical protein